MSHQLNTSSPADMAPTYPGLGRPVDWKDSRAPYYPMASRGDTYPYKTFPLPVREVAMMIVMDRLTDKTDWHKKVFDDDIVAKWRLESMALDDGLWRDITETKESLAERIMRQGQGRRGVRNFTQDEIDNVVVPLSKIMDAPTFDACVQELRAKARYWKQSGLIPTLDADASVVKSDTLVGDELHAELGAAFARLQADQAACPDWHPGTDSMVQNLVHPSMYPLVYGRSGAFRHEVVGVQDAVDKWAGKWDVIPEAAWSPPPESARFGFYCPAKPAFVSAEYQWLPANLGFQDDGSLHFTSYINNLHPTKYADIYKTIEKLITLALPAWDQCLAHVDNWKKLGVGRTETRFDIKDRDDMNEDNWHVLPLLEATDGKEFDTDSDGEVDLGSGDSDDSYSIDDEDRMLYVPIQPTPSVEECEKEGYYAPGPGKRLIDRFRDSGLQVIVKMVSMELTPEKPQIPAGSWHVEGQANENICGTALYYVDSENTTDSSLSFRVQTLGGDLDEEPAWQVSQDGHKWMDYMYGTAFHAGADGSGIQNYGNVNTPAGRLLAFPNVFQHRVHPFRLIDPTKPGRRRFIALWLVDPHIRILSTANIPPQQRDWYFDSILGETISARQETLRKMPPEISNMLIASGALSSDSSSESQDEEEGVKWLPTRLPNELVNEIRRYSFIGDQEEQKEEVDMRHCILPMTREEAIYHREMLMKGRTEFHTDNKLKWKSNTYNFCEH